MRTWRDDIYDRRSELYHHGIKGQKWGVRRYQNPDGTLTEAGLKRALKAGKYYEKAKNYGDKATESEKDLREGKKKDNSQT